MFTVILLCLCLSAAWLMRKHTKEDNKHKLPPTCPGELPIIGHTHKLAFADSKGIWSFFKEISADCVENNGVAYIKLAGDIYYLITDPEDALTAANSCPKKHFVYNFAKIWLGDGLLTCSGDIYKRHRKLLGPGYTTTTVQNYLQLFNSQARKLAEVINAYSGNGPCDPLHAMKNMILETSYLTTFGTRIKDDNLIKHYMTATDEILGLFTLRGSKGYLQNNFIYKLFGLQRKETLLVKYINQLVDEVIQEKKMTLNDANANNDKTALMTELTYKPMVNFLIELNEVLTDKELKDELHTNIVASYHSLAHMLLNILVLLGTYPEVQEKMYTECIQVLGTERDVEKNDLHRLVYTKAVIKESLRVMPIAPVVARYIDKEVKLKNYTMRAGSQCIILVYGIHRTAAWGSDVEQFKPERWLDPASLPAKANAFAGFSLGRRSCPGTTYAMTLLSVILAHLARRYTWTADVTKMKLQFEVTLKSSGYNISIERRAHCV